MRKNKVAQPLGDWQGDSGSLNRYAGLVDPGGPAARALPRLGEVVPIEPETALAAPGGVDSQAVGLVPEAPAQMLELTGHLPLAEVEGAGKLVYACGVIQQGVDEVPAVHGPPYSAPMPMPSMIVPQSGQVPSRAIRLSRAKKP